MKKEKLIKRTIKIKKYVDIAKEIKDVEFDVFYNDNEWMITNYDVVNIYDDYEEFKEVLTRLILC